MTGNWLSQTETSSLFHKIPFSKHTLLVHVINRMQVSFASINVLNSAVQTQESSLFFDIHEYPPFALVSSPWSQRTRLSGASNARQKRHSVSGSRARDCNRVAGERVTCVCHAAVLSIVCFILPDCDLRTRRVSRRRHHQP